jgi:hypothetical protein
MRAIRLTGNKVSKENCYLDLRGIFDPEEGESLLLRQARAYPPNYTAS